MPHHESQRAPQSPEQLIARLKAGNRRFAGGQPSLADSSPLRRAQLAAGQSPQVAILACSDSRVAPELVFDQGLGDLFVVRVAGNVLDDTVLASLQYAVEHLGVAMVILLGHSACGAVTSACSCDFEALDPPTSRLLGAIEPAVDVARSRCCAADELVDASARINVERQTRTLLQSPVMRQAVAEGRLTVHGAWYDLSSGLIEWL